MFILRLCSVLLTIVQVSCVAGNSLVSDLNRQSRGLQMEAIRESQSGDQMLADRNQLASQLVDHEPDVPFQTASEPPAKQQREGKGTPAPSCNANSPFKDGGL